MALEPETWPASLRQSVRRGLALGAVAGSVLVAGWFGSDLLVARVVDHFRPRLERQIGEAMGHPVQLGPFRGLSLDGLRLGPSRFLKGERDASTASVDGLLVSFDPVASWWRKAAVLDLSLAGARADLRRNANGQFWVLGPTRPGQKPPALDMRFRLLQPGRVRLWLGGPETRPLEFTAVGQAGVRTHRRDVDLRAKLRLPGQEGSAELNGSGQWQRKRWRVDLYLRRLALAPFQSLLPQRRGSAAAPWGLLAGDGNGPLTLTWRQGVAACRGDLQLHRLRWRQSAGATPLSFERMPLQCRDQQLEVASTAWRFGKWNGQIAGRIATDRRLALRLQARPGVSHPLGRIPFVASLQGRWQAGGLQITRLDASRGASNLRANGRLGSRLDLTAHWRLYPNDLPGAERLPTWLRQRPLDGSLRADGKLQAPRIAVETGQSEQALIGPWQASLQWRDQMLRLDRLRSGHLEATADLPLGFRSGRGWVLGELVARLSLRNYPLARLNPLLGTQLQGRLDGGGSIQGPLAALRPDFALQVARPGAGPLRLDETWRGTLLGSGRSGSRLQLSALAPAVSGRIAADLDQRWQPVRLQLNRQEGELLLTGSPRRYQWNSRRLPLAGLAVATGKKRPYQPLLGDLSGSGWLELQPLAFSGKVDLEQPQFLGVGGRRIMAAVRYVDRAYAIKGHVEPMAAGTIAADIQGRWQGPFQARFQVRQLSSVLFQQLARAWPLWQGRPAPERGKASDLGSLAIDTIGGTINDQLLALQMAEARLARRNLRELQATRAERLNRLQSSIDADLTLRGPNLQRVHADLVATGHLWLSQDDRDQVLASEPFEVRLDGPIVQGAGNFSLAGLPLSLLALLTPVPESLRGTLAAKGRYRLGGVRPDLEVELSLADASLGKETISLSRGKLNLEGDGVAVDLALLADGASSSVDLVGTLPLDPQAKGLELRLASRGDGLRFLTKLAGRALEWKRGSADLQLLVRGSLADPIANGFLRVREGEFQFIGQRVQGLEATLLFDFEQLLLQELRASVGTNGRISGEGQIGLVRPLSEDQSLLLKLVRVPFKMERIKAEADGRISFGGSLVSPNMGGDLSISRGSIDVQPGTLAVTKPKDGEPASDQPARPIDINELVESKWDFRQPLVLLGPDVESPTGESLRQGVPDFPYLAFKGLRLKLGPDLRVLIGNVANFTTGGSLRIAGRLDPSLQISGVVRLLGGRLTLFTTTFNLDPDTPNVAVFTPSLGLVPYLDIALRTRISDSLNVLSPSGVGEPSGPSVTQAETASGFSSLNQLNLILVTVSVSGPADRLADNLQLRSSPALPVNRLVALIGGNSLAGLSGGGAGTALAAVVGQSLLSPLLSSLTTALGQRVSLALYPTYVNPKVSREQELRSERVPPQLVLGTEIGVDLSKRFKASVLAAPNRSDVPPQLNLNYKASENFTLEGSFDTQGAWQAQLRYFFRF